MIKYIMTAALLALFAVPADARPTNDLSGEFCGTHYCGSRSVEVNIQVRFKRTLPKEAIPHCSHFGCAEARSTSKARKRIHGDPTQSQIVSHPAGCPRTLFCGCGVSVHVWGVAKKAFYTARAYYSLPRATCAPGMVAVLNAHHVAAIESCDGNGIATLYDPNSGSHLTRIHQRDISHATIVNPHGGRYAAN